MCGVGAVSAHFLTDLGGDFSISHPGDEGVAKGMKGEADEVKEAWFSPSGERQSPRGSRVHDNGISPRLGLRAGVNFWR